MTVNVASNASSPQVNHATVSGGGSPSAIAADSTIVGGAVTAISVTPSSGTGLIQTFALQYSDTAGTGGLSSVSVWFSPTPSSMVNSCVLSYSPPTNTLSLLDSAGVQWVSGTPGSGGILQNSSCFVSLSSSSLVLGSNTLTLNLAMTFEGGYAGTKNVFMSATDTTGSATGWQAHGTWTVPATTATVTADSVMPNSGVGSGQTFTLQYTDTAGPASFGTARVLFSAGLPPGSANSCEVSYNRQSGAVSLLNDAGVPGVAGTLGSGTLQNSQCSIFLATSSGTFAGNTLTLSLAVGFKPAFLGSKLIYLFGSDASGASSGWQARGNWSVTAPNGAISVYLACPNQITAGSRTACAVNLFNGSAIPMDRLSLGLLVTPNGSAPPLTTGQLGWSDPSTVTSSGPNTVSVTLLGTSGFAFPGGELGSAGFTVPAGALPGQSYSVAITGVSASNAGVPASVLISPTSFITIPVPGAPSCNTNVTVTPNVRGEGYTEQVGDITLTCSGGTVPAINTAISQADITVVFNSAVTSRLLPVSGVSGAVSEALLLIDEPGSGLPAPVAGFGPGAAQNVCATPMQGCVEYVSQKAGSSIPVATDTQQGTTAASAGKNVFRGIVNGNSVTFYGVPVLAPGATASRVFRISNIRVDASQLCCGTLSGAAPVLASILVSGVGAFNLSNSSPFVGFVTKGLTTGVTSAPTLNQCSAQTLSPASTLSFTENFGTSFKTRVLAQNNSNYAGQSGTPVQNIPGAIYNSESNFVLPVASGQTAGLTDFGTRLKAVFRNVPAGVHLFVSVANVQNSGLPVAVPAVIGGSAANSSNPGFAQLVSSETGGFAAVSPTAFGPGVSGTVPVAEIPVANGSGVAVWEVVNTNPNTNETFQFAVHTSYTALPGQNSPPPGTATVNLSYAAAPPSFAEDSGGIASATLTIPRFVADPYAPNNILTIAAGSCPSLSISKTHSGSFAQGQNGATYALTVVNSATGGATNGTVTVTETVPSGMTLVSLAGAGWTCPNGATCTRGDTLAPGASYPPITATVNVAANASSPLVNQVSVSGGGGATANASDSTVVTLVSVPTSAVYVKTDSVAQGTWKGVYGGDGEAINGDGTNYPGYAQVSMSGQGPFVWTASTADVRGLQKAAATDRIASGWYTFTNMSTDVNLIDGNTHQVAMYFLDWDAGARAERIDCWMPRRTLCSIRERSPDSRAVYGWSGI